MDEASLDWLKKQAKLLTKKHWDIDYIPEISIDLDRELNWEKCVAFYCPDIKTIAFNSVVNGRRTLTQIKRTLLHELCHWWLHINNLPYRDSDERFARELIRVGISSNHNKDERALEAMRKAKETKSKEVFEIYEDNGDEIITSRLKHSRKNQEDFKKDLAKTLIEMHNDRVKSGNYDQSIYPADVADMMCKWHGYKLEPKAVYGIELSNGINGYGEVGDRDDIWIRLQELGININDIEGKLLEENDE